MELKKLQALYGLKWNPFIPNLPVEALQQFAKTERFCFRVEDLVLDGGFAAVMGEPGIGKSALLRVLQERITQVPRVVVGELTRPQCSVSDFYREIGDLFGVQLKVTNRYAGHQSLRQKWRNHIESTLMRPVLLIDEAQRLNDAIFDELKSLSSDRLDTQMLITVVLAGDLRLVDRLSTTHLKPIDSRLRPRLVLGPWESVELTEYLQSAIRLAGAPALMTSTLVDTLVDRAMGNLRTLMNLCNECLSEGARIDAPRLDEKLFFDVYGENSSGPRRASLKGKKS
jgi:general secretion pathway protein A